MGSIGVLFAPNQISPGTLKESIDGMLDRFHSGELFSHDNQTADAFIAIVSKDGSLIRDRVIGDLRGRMLSSICVLDGQLIAGGLANGTSNWVTSLAWFGLH